MLHKVYITSIGEYVFNDCTSLKTIFAPSLETTLSSFENNNINIYLSDSCTELIDSKSNLHYPATKYNYNIIAPSSSYAEKWANENGHTFIPSDYRDTANDKLDDTEDVNVRAYGRSIRVTNAGLRFGFEWEEIPEIEDLASNVEYGFIYHYNYNNEPFSSDKLTVDNVEKDSVKMKQAVNLDDTTEGKTVFNLVFTNIPDANQSTNISVRAYVCIDGMYFYSNMLNGSFSEVANLILADDEVDINTKNAINNLLCKEV